MSDPVSKALRPLQDTSILAEHAAVIRRLQRRVIADVVEIGRRLCECKPLVGHGHWLPWLKREFDLSERTARNFINAYKLVEGKPETVADLRIEVSAFYLIARPSVPEEIRVEVLREAALRPVSRADVKAMLVPSATKRRLTVEGAIDGLGLREFAELPSAEQAKIIDERPENLELAIQDAHTRRTWPHLSRQRAPRRGAGVLQRKAFAPVSEVPAVFAEARAVPRRRKESRESVGDSSSAKSFGSREAARAQ